MQHDDREFVCEVKAAMHDDIRERKALIDHLRGEIIAIKNAASSHHLGQILGVSHTTVCRAWRGE